MKTVVVLLGLLAASPALASPEDDYVACLVGRAGVALINNAAKDADAAQAIAYAQCAQPDNMSPDVDLDGLEDMVNFMVIDMAKGEAGE